jgi:hypothetical protein
MTTAAKSMTAVVLRVKPYLFDATAIAAALALKALSPSPAWIESHYSNGLYPALDRAVRACTGGVPFCVSDVLCVAALAWLVRYWIVSLRRSRGARTVAAARAIVRTFAAFCLLYVWFLVSWAFNYGRVPLAEKIVVHNERTSGASVDAFADKVVDELSRYARAAHRERPDDDASVAQRLLPTFEATIARLGDRSQFAPPRVKPTVFQPFMQLSATSGFTNPWTHEVNVNAEAFTVERPALYAHEWAHLSGFADEGEANFISAVACTTAHDPLLAYSGWLLVWFNLPPDVHLTHRLSRTAYRDITAIRDRYQREENAQVARAQQVAYDSYLKSNRVAAGYASYQLFIRWMTGADFDRAGLPMVRAKSS